MYLEWVLNSVQGEKSTPASLLETLDPNNDSEKHINILGMSRELII